MAERVKKYRKGSSQFNLRVPKSYRERLEKISKDEDRSMADVAWSDIERGMNGGKDVRIVEKFVEVEVPVEKIIEKVVIKKVEVEKIIEVKSEENPLYEEFLTAFLSDVAIKNEEVVIGGLAMRFIKISFSRLSNKEIKRISKAIGGDGRTITKLATTLNDVEIA